MNFQEEIQKLPAYEEFLKWLMLDKRDEMVVALKLNPGDSISDNFYRLPFSFQLGVYLEWLESKRFHLIVDECGYYGWECIIKKFGEDESIPTVWDNDGLHKNEAWKRGIIEAFKLLSK